MEDAVGPEWMLNESPIKGTNNKRRWIVVIPIELLIGWVLFGLIGAAIGPKKGINTMGAFLAGVLLGPFALLMVFVTSNIKPCPQCAEKVNKDAKVCKHCGFKFGQ